MRVIVGFGSLKQEQNVLGLRISYQDHGGAVRTVAADHLAVVPDAELPIGRDQPTPAALRDQWDIMTT